MSPHIISPSTVVLDETGSPVQKISLYFLVLLIIYAFSRVCFADPLTIEINQGVDALPKQVSDVDHQSQSGFVQIIDQQQISDNSLDLTQVIENQSGIKIRNQGGFGSQALVSIRGKSSKQVMVYVDGMLMNNASGGSVDLSYISASQIARVEIYKDVVPIEFGQVSNGGVINIITQRAGENSIGKVGLSLASFDTEKANISMLGNHKKWRYTISGNIIHSQNNFPFTNQYGTPYNTDDDFPDTRKNNGFDQRELLSKLNFALSSKRTLFYQGEIMSRRKEIPSIYNDVDTDSSIASDKKSIQLGYEDKSFVLRNLQLSFNSKLSNKSNLFDDRNAKIRVSGNLVQQQIDSLEGDLILKLHQRSFELVSRSDLRSETLNLSDKLSPSADRQNQRYTASSGLQAHLYFLQRKWIVSPATRVFFSHDRYAKTSGDTQTERSRYFTVSSQIGSRFSLNRDLTLKANAAQYYRLPNYVELFGTRGYYGSNDSLVPEKGTNFDLGIDFEKPFVNNLVSRVQWNASVFHSIIEDEIVYYFNARGEGKPFNNRLSIITGLENNINVELLFELELTSNTTLQLPLNQTDPNNVMLLAGRPIWLQTTRLDWHRTQWHINLEHVWESSYFYDNTQRLPSGEKSVVNLGTDYQYDVLKLSFAVNNVFNHNYKDYYFQVSPGRYLVASINYQFQ